MTKTTKAASKNNKKQLEAPTPPPAVYIRVSGGVAEYVVEPGRRVAVMIWDEDSADVDDQYPPEPVTASGEIDWTRIRNQEDK